MEKVRKRLFSGPCWPLHLCSVISPSLYWVLPLSKHASTLSIVKRETWALDPFRCSPFKAKPLNELPGVRLPLPTCCPTHSNQLISPVRQVLLTRVTFLHWPHLTPRAFASRSSLLKHFLLRVSVTLPDTYFCHSLRLPSLLASSSPLDFELLGPSLFFHLYILPGDLIV